jgi:hypothetical protein
MFGAPGGLSRTRSYLLRARLSATSPTTVPEPASLLRVAASVTLLAPLMQRHRRRAGP